MKQILYVIGCIFLLSCADNGRKNILENVSAKKAQAIIDESSVVVLDVRTENEFRDGHIKNAININCQSSDFMDKIQNLDKSTTYVLHCKSGGRSTFAINKMKELGFSTIYHMNGGMNEWANNKLPIEK
ncbi:rhodanese-like domain-containing protein [Candidatus Uabimicrobium sp. HlEnr_7]|uniref:rhodanese-like domain-containing protein n=1 Tax=Candidatus Uabimicrobium helgolandensis TaxID=3095367 RepID=UPI0035576C46